MCKNCNKYIHLIWCIGKNLITRNDVSCMCSNDSLVSKLRPCGAAVVDHITYRVFPRNIFKKEWNYYTHILYVLYV